MELTAHRKGKVQPGKGGGRLYISYLLKANVVIDIGVFDWRVIHFAFNSRAHECLSGSNGVPRATMSRPVKPVIVIAQ